MIKEELMDKASGFMATVPFDVNYTVPYFLNDSTKCMMMGDANEKVVQNINELRNAIMDMEQKIIELQVLSNHLLEENKNLKNKIPGPKRELNYGK